MNETRLFRIGLSVLALRVLDDTVLQPEPGTSVVDHPLSAGVPLALLALAAWVFPRLRGTSRGALALLIGVFGIATGVDAVYYTRELGFSSGDITGFIALGAALTAGRPWRRARCGARAGRRAASPGATRAACFWPAPPSSSSRW